MTTSDVVFTSQLTYYTTFFVLLIMYSPDNVKVMAKNKFASK